MEEIVRFKYFVHIFNFSNKKRKFKTPLKYNSFFTLNYTCVLTNLEIKFPDFYLLKKIVTVTFK